MRRRLPPFLLTASLVLASCGDDDPSGPAAGSFTADVTGVLSATLSGQAIFGVTSTAYIMGFTSADGHYVVALARDGGRPGTGQFDIGAGTADFDAVITIDPTPAQTNSGDERLFASTEGTLVLSVSSADRAAGTFTIVAADLEVDAQTITLTGTFDAICATSTGAC